MWTMVHTYLFVLMYIAHHWIYSLDNIMMQLYIRVIMLVTIHWHECIWQVTNESSDCVGQRTWAREYMSHVIMLKIIIARFNLLLTGVDHYLYLCSGDMTAETHHLSSAEDCEKFEDQHRKEEITTGKEYWWVGYH